MQFSQPYCFARLAAAQQNVRTVFLVRHAEKASTAADAPLSPEGEKRAECLAATLKDAGIKQIYVTDVTRTQQTAAPLAKALKIKPTILPAKDPNALIKNLAYTGGGNILVVGHSDTVPFVIARLQGGTVAPIGENEYDRMFVMTSCGSCRNASGDTALLQCRKRWQGCANTRASGQDTREGSSKEKGLTSFLQRNKTCGKQKGGSIETRLCYVTFQCG